MTETDSMIHAAILLSIDRDIDISFMTKIQIQY